MTDPLARVAAQAVSDGFRSALQWWGIILASAAGTRQAPRNELAIPGGIELALEVDLPFPDECADDGERLSKTRHSSIEGKAEGPIFGLVPSRAKSEDQPSTADLIHGGGHLGEHRRVVKARGGDKRPDCDSAGHGRDARQHRPCLPRSACSMDIVAIKEMIAKPH